MFRSIEISEDNKSYENPNYRKLYAKISMEQMIGKELAGNTEECLAMSETIIKPDQSEPIDIADISKESNETDGSAPNDLEFYYDDEYGDYYDDDDEEDDLSDGYFDYEAAEKQGLMTKVANKSSTSNGEQSKMELPEGWERHEDELGPYFWHIPTGTIQREKPFLHTIDKSMIRSDSLVFLDKSAINADYNPTETIEEEEECEASNSNVCKQSATSFSPDTEKKIQKVKTLNNRQKVIANLRLTFPVDSEDENCDDDSENYLSFVVHSLGWMNVEESQINSNTGSLAIKKCIHELTNKTEGAAKCWGVDTQSMLLRISLDKITLLDAVTETVLSIQMIREIRMWAVDEKNNFAYVAKDKTSPIKGSSLGQSSKSNVLKCHVFYCDETVNENSAQKIAIYLKDALIRIKNSRLTDPDGVQRPISLLKSHQTLSDPVNMQNINSFEFPTPIEERKKMLPALYMGSAPVSKPMGVEVLNMAIVDVATSLKMSMTNDTRSEVELMRPVYVHVSPSNIIVECQETGTTLFECRVRLVWDRSLICSIIFFLDAGTCLFWAYHWTT